MGNVIHNSIACFSTSDIVMDKIYVWHRPIVCLTRKFQAAVCVNQFR